MTILSILMATTADRWEMFDRLYDSLQKQIMALHAIHPTLGRVEVIVDDSKRFLEGGLSIGAKRQSLLDKASGRYVCYLDSDETIAPNYVETLVRLCHAGKDVVTFRNITKLENYWTVVDMSLEFDNEEATPIGIVKRKAWHVCPVKTLYAKMFRFPDTNYAEDWEWFSQVLTLCSSEAKTDAILHQYNHGAHSEADRIIKSQTI